MALNLPSSPAIGDTFVISGLTFEWDGSTWNKVAMAGTVRTVNGISPDVLGNVAVAITEVRTGTLAARPTVTAANEGMVYVVSGDPTAANDGRTFIVNNVGAWVEIGGANAAANDARYVLKAGDAGMTGNFVITRTNGTMQLDGLGVQIDSIPAGASADLLADELVIRETGVGRTEVNAGSIELTDGAGAAAIPTLPEHVTTKQYVDGLLGGGSSGGSAGVWRANWDAAANIPPLTDPPPGPPTYNNGDYFLVTTQATRFGRSWQVGDKIMQVAGMTAGSYAWYRIPAEYDQPDTMNVWVSSVVGNNANSGTITRQKQTINGALLVVNATSGGNIFVGAGSYSDNISLSAASVGIEGVGGLPRPQTVLSGPLTAVGGFPRLRNFEFTGVMNLNAVNNTTIVEGVAFSGPGASLSGNNGAGGTIYVTDCDFTRANSQTPIQFFNGNGTVYMSNVIGARVAIGPGWTVYIKDCPDIHIRNQGGTFIFQDAGPTTVNGILTSDAEVTTLISTGADGLYAVNYANPVNANIPDLERGCVLIVKTWSFGRMVTVHRPAAFASGLFRVGTALYMPALAGAVSGDFLRYDGSKWLPALAPGSIRVGQYTVPNASWNALSGSFNWQFLRAGVGFNGWCNNDGSNAAQFTSIALQAGATYELTASIGRMTGDFNNDYNLQIYFCDPTATGTALGRGQMFSQGSPTAKVFPQPFVQAIVTPTVNHNVVLRTIVGAGNPSVFGAFMQMTVKQIG